VTRMTHLSTAIAALLLMAGAGRSDEIRFSGSAPANRCTVVSFDDRAVEIRLPVADVSLLRPGKERKDAFPDSLRLEGHSKDLKVRFLALKRDTVRLRIARGDVADLKIEKQSKGQKPTPGTAGSATGTIFVQGKPAGAVKVRVVRTRVSTFLGNRHTREHESHAATTAADGSYRFERLSPGHYKIYVQLEEKEAWIRRLRDEPDFEVKAGMRTSVKPVRIPKRVH